jgi:hypothetical protein
LKGKWKTATLTASLVAVVAGAYALGMPAYRRANPDAAFSSLVGVPVPAGVRIVQYSSGLTDNFFHTTHFWLIEGDIGALRKLVEGTRFGRSNEDAAWELPDAATHLGLKLTPQDLAEGYESDDARNRWFLVLKGRQQAIYVL